MADIHLDDINILMEYKLVWDSYIQALAWMADSDEECSDDDSKSPPLFPQLENNRDFAETHPNLWPVIAPLLQDREKERLQTSCWRFFQQADRYLTSNRKRELAGRYFAYETTGATSFHDCCDDFTDEVVEELHELASAAESWHLSGYRNPAGELQACYVHS